MFHIYLGKKNFRLGSHMQFYDVWPKPSIYNLLSFEQSNNFSRLYQLLYMGE